MSYYYDEGSDRYYDKKSLKLFNKGVKCTQICSSSETKRGTVAPIPLSCIDWQVSYKQQLFCAGVCKRRNKNE